eukprot:g9057.t1
MCRTQQQRCELYQEKNAARQLSLQKNLHQHVVPFLGSRQQPRAQVHGLQLFFRDSWAPGWHGGPSPDDMPAVSFPTHYLLALPVLCFVYLLGLGHVAQPADMYRSHLCPCSSPLPWTPCHCGRDCCQVAAELKQKGVKTLICLQEQINPVVAQKLAAAGVRYLHFPVEDMHPPSQQTLEQIAQVLLEAKEMKNGAVSVHCMAGKGRTGTVLAVGLTLVSDPALSARDAIKEVVIFSLNPAFRCSSLANLDCTRPANNYRYLYLSYTSYYFCHSLLPLYGKR